MSDYEILRTVARQAPLSMGFSRQGYWSGLLFPTPGDLPKPGIKPAPPALASGFFFYHRVTWGTPDTLRQIQRSRAFYRAINCVIKSFLPAMCPQILRGFQPVSHLRYR